MPHTPTGAGSTAREARLGFRLSRQQERLIRHAAEVTHKKVTDFILESACSAAEQALLDQRFFLADEDQWQRFQEALDSPPDVKPRLRELLATPAPWESKEEKS